MKRIFGLTAALAVLLTATPAAAQMYGSPVYVPVGVSTGINIAGDFGKGMNDASLKTTYYGARASLGLAAFYVMAGVGSVKADDALVPGGTSQTAFGGTLGYNILRLPMTPVKISIQAGAGYIKEGSFKQLDFPVALGIGFSLPTPGVGITPWVAPRLHVRSQDDGTNSETKARFGGSGGVNVSIGMIGIHLAVDYLSIPVPEGATGSSGDYSPLVFGAGLNFGINVPGL
ncbi:MAG: hypothetical protein OEW06_02250 [Gemmatimonadota bacterium]|nr:hypothetical protein [Gemmatimonadota bacterium]MDH4351067.1 hypothetical protein [Gemmatimonadota bacterium]